MGAIPMPRIMVFCKIKFFKIIFVDSENKIQSYSRHMRKLKLFDLSCFKCLALSVDDKCDLNKTVILIKTHHRKRKGWDFLMNRLLEQWKLCFLVRLEFDQYSNPPRALFVQSKHYPCKNSPIGNSRDWNTGLALWIKWSSYEMRDISLAISQISWME